MGHQRLHADIGCLHGARGSHRRHLRAPALAARRYRTVRSRIGILRDRAVRRRRHRVPRATGCGRRLHLSGVGQRPHQCLPGGQVESGHRIGLRHSGLGNAAGPLVGGLLTQTVGWRAVFWMLVPLAAVSFLIGARTIPETSDETVPRRLDLSGLALITTGIGLFTFAFDRAPSWGWLSAATLGAFIAAAAVLAAFVVVEQRVRWPLVNLALLRNSKFSTLVVAGTIANIAYTVTVFLSTMNLQQVRGLDPLTAGIAFLGPSAGAALGGVISGRLAARYSPIRVMGIGCAVAAVSLGVLAASQQWVVYLVALTACGFTMGLVYAFTTVATQTVVAPERAGEAAGVTLTSLVTIAGVGIAVSGTVLEMLQRHGLSMGGGIKSILAVIAALLLPAGLAVLRSARSTASAPAEPN